MILEYRRECGSSDIVQSLCEPHEVGITENGVHKKSDNNISLLNGYSQWASETLEGNGLLRCFDEVQLWYTHLLQAKREEIARGRTSWKRKHSTSRISAQSCVWFK